LYIFLGTKLKANVFHHDFNPCGGAERVSFATMQAITAMGIDFDITTYTEPDVSRIVKAYGKDHASIIKSPKKLNIVSSFKNLVIKNKVGKEYDININTHPDLFPFYQNHFCKENTITYSHFPMAWEYIESENIEYIERDLRIQDYECEAEASQLSYDADRIQSKSDIDRCFRMVRSCYEKLMENSTIITNSEFTRNSIASLFNGGKDKAHIIRPPVDVETFHNEVLLSSAFERQDTILVISRIHKHKKIENAIRLAKILKKINVVEGMRIIGSMDYTHDLDYFLSLYEMVRNFDLEGYVTIDTNISFKELLSAMGNAKTYFHPMVGEHFGIAVVEAMAAGLVPIVPAVGGPAEFVPSNYQFNTIEEAAEKVSSSLQVAEEERVRISNSVDRFSVINYIDQFQKVVSRMLF
jgi:glycosyltransferase involved in cell wall biosynthesis